jgi:hypothetical protein
VPTAATARTAVTFVTCRGVGRAGSRGFQIKSEGETGDLSVSLKVAALYLNVPAYGGVRKL